MWLFERVKPFRTIDGDSVELLVDTGFFHTARIQVRLLGVDTPERGQDGYEQAKTFTAEWMQGTPFQLECYGPDKFGGRWLGKLRAADGGTISQDLIEAGLGKFYDGGKK